MDSRRGRGLFVIRHARLYEVPLTMTLLQIINLTWPSSRSFDRASADFVIDGDRLRLEGIRFEAPSVQMIGSGWLNYVDHRTDMSFVTRNPKALELGPLSDVWTIMKDELWTIRLTGTLEKPQARLEPLTGVRRSWQEIFSPSSP